MILCFEGIVESCVEPDDGHNYLATRIGGRSVVEEIRATFTGHSGNPWGTPKRVFVALADERFEGDLEVYAGSCGYSEWTPPDEACLKVGDHDVFRRLDAMDGQHVTLWIADEPVNTLER